jgi:hypothetical protein
MQYVGAAPAAMCGDCANIALASGYAAAFPAASRVANLKMPVAYPKEAFCGPAYNGATSADFCWSPH